VLTDRFDALIRRRPWIAGLLSLGLAAVIGVTLAHTETRLPPHGPAQALLLVAGALVPVALYFAGMRVGGALGMAMVAAAAVLAIVGLSLGLGASRYGGTSDPATLPRGLQAFGAGIVAAWVAALAALPVVAFVRRPEPRPARSNTHRVVVHDVRPYPDRPKNAFDPYFVAICDCGWVGKPEGSEPAARADAHRHHPNVVDAVERPLA